VLVRGGGFYAFADTPRPPALVISYAAVNGADLSRSLAAIGAAYRELVPDGYR
jgi:GntR family transcriptional regulator/MocR family aminotransferase